MRNNIKSLKEATIKVKYFDDFKRLISKHIPN